MRHYSLVPVRYNAQQLLTRCEPIDAELWSIQWRNALDTHRWFDPETAQVIHEPMHWFADCSPLEKQTAQNIVDWLNAYEQMTLSRSA